MMNRDRGDNPKLTLLPFLITAMGKALADWPMLNATFDDDADVAHPPRRDPPRHGDPDPRRADGAGDPRRPEPRACGSSPARSSASPTPPDRQGHAARN